MDVHIPFAITAQLRLRQIDVLTAQEDSTRRLEDAELLDRSTELQRVLVSQDIDLLRITGLRNSERRQLRGLDLFAPDVRHDRTDGA